MANLILCGLKACGKSYFGMRLAQRLDWPFIDTDQRLIDLYCERTRQRLSCPEIYKKVGEAAFRFLETEIITQLVDATQSVIALGGGTLIAPENRKSLCRLGTLLYLALDRESLKQRICRVPLPAFLDEKDPEGSFECYYTTRSQLYESLSLHKIELSAKSDEEILEEMIYYSGLRAK